MNHQWHVRTRTAEDTYALGAAIARLLGPGDVVALTGELGAGKTCLVQGAGAALGVKARMTSPSFVLRKDYVGDVEVMHIDVYRLETLQDVVDIGWEEALDGRRVTFIEWGDAVSPLLPAGYLEIEFSVDGDETRQISVRVRGDEWLRRSAALAEAINPWADVPPTPSER